MAELMAHRAYPREPALASVGLFVAVELAGGGIFIDFHPVDLQRTTEVRLGELILLRPDGFFGSAHCLAPSGVDDDHLVYLSVAIPVVVGIVDRVGGQLTGLGHHLPYVYIAEGVVLSVVFHVLGELDGTDDIEGQVELPVRLLKEVVVDGALEVALLVAGVVHDAVHGGLGVGVGIVGIFGQDDQPASLARHDAAWHGCAFHLRHALLPKQAKGLLNLRQTGGSRIGNATDRTIRLGYKL